MTPDPSSVAPKKSNTPVIIIAIVVAVMTVCGVIGILAAIAIPNFVRFGARSKQSEVKVNLKGAFVGEQAQFMDQQTYSEHVDEIGFMPERGNRYRYLLSTEGEVQPRDAAVAPPGTFTGVGVDRFRHGSIDEEALERAIPRALWNDIGLTGTCPDDCSMTIVAAGNLDTDDTVDVWSISTKARTLDGQSVPAGVPHCHVDDTKE